MKIYIFLRKHTRMGFQEQLSHFGEESLDIKGADTVPTIRTENIHKS